MVGWFVELVSDDFGPHLLLEDTYIYASFFFFFVTIFDSNNKNKNKNKQEEDDQVN